MYEVKPDVKTFTLLIDVTHPNAAAEKVNFLKNYLIDKLKSIIYDTNTL